MPNFLFGMQTYTTPLVLRTEARLNGAPGRISIHAICSITGIAQSLYLSKWDSVRRFSLIADVRCF